MTSNDGAPHEQAVHQHAWQTLVEFDLSFAPGNEHLGVERLTGAMQNLNWAAAFSNKLKLALAEAVREASEGAGQYGSAGTLVIRVLLSEVGGGTGAANQPDTGLTVCEGSEPAAQTPGRRPSGGQGFFLVQKLEDTPEATGGSQHVVELYVYQ